MVYLNSVQPDNTKNGGQQDKGGLMKNKRQAFAQRTQRRFEVKEKAFAMLKAPWPRSTEVVGQILDISRGGLALRHILLRGDIESERRIDRASEVMIVTSDHCFQLTGVPIKKIWDFEISENLFAGIITKRCSIKFGELTSQQVFQLNCFIRDYAKDNRRARRFQTIPNRGQVRDGRDAYI